MKSETLYAKFVIGADGARSWVRKQMDITLDGEQTGMYLCDMRMYS